MNLILYSHLFTNVIFKNDDEIFVSDGLTYLDYIKGNWNKLKLLLEENGINIYIFMNLLYKDLFNYLSKQKRIDDYGKLLKIEKEIENIIDNKIFIQEKLSTSRKMILGNCKLDSNPFPKKKKIIEKVQEKKDKDNKISTKKSSVHKGLKKKKVSTPFSSKNFILFRDKDPKYKDFANFYEKNIVLFRDKDPKSKVSIIKEINTPEFYKEEEYPYYKNFLYSDYPDEAFLKARLEELGKEKYPVIYLYLNREKMKKGINKEFIQFNFVIKSLLNEFSNKISRNVAKKLTFEKTFVYKKNEKICDAFIKIIKTKNKDISKESCLENFLIDRSNKEGKLYIDMYERYAESQNKS